jgi:hypothetical protein
LRLLLHASESVAELLVGGLQLVDLVVGCEEFGAEFVGLVGLSLEHLFEGGAGVGVGEGLGAGVVCELVGLQLGLEGGEGDGELVVFLLELSQLELLRLHLLAVVFTQRQQLVFVLVELAH